MGTWGIGSFDNDDAADFMIDVLDSGDLSLVREVLDNVLTSTEYVEAPDAALAIVGAEIVAAAAGRPTLAAQQEEGLADWLARIRPSMSGPTKPPSCDSALIQAIPPAAATPERNALGRVQKIASQAIAPIATSVSATTDSTAACPAKASISSPAAETSSESVACQRRSPVRSE